MLVSSAALILSPLTWESQLGRDGLLSNSQNTNFYSYYAFYTSYTEYRNGTSSEFPNIGLAGSINITYSGNGIYEVRAVLSNSLNNSEIYGHVFNVTETSMITQWLLPSGQYQVGQSLNLWNGSNGQISVSPTTYGTSPFSKQGVVRPYAINANNIEYANKTVLNTSFMDIASIGPDQYMNVGTIWSGYLAPFTEIFPMVKYSTELVFGLDKTNVKLGPLDTWDTYVVPMFFFAAVLDTVIVASYLLTVTVVRNRNRNH